jgi:hypothetical protein
VLHRVFQEALQRGRARLQSEAWRRALWAVIRTATDPGAADTAYAMATLLTTDAPVPSIAQLAYVCCGRLGCTHEDVGRCGRNGLGLAVPTLRVNVQ